MALTKIKTGIVEDAIAREGFKNKIIGGDFSSNPWQRGTTFATIASGAYSADRWKYTKVSEAVHTISRSLDAPTIAQAGLFTQHCLSASVTTIDTTIDAGQYVHLSQTIEGLNIREVGFGQAGSRKITLSFWHKHTKVGTYCVSFTNSAENRSYVAEYVQDVTNTWEKATITLDVDTTGTWLYDNGAGLNVRFAMASGSTFQTTANTWVAGNFLATSNQVNSLDNTNNSFRIALVQLEVGSEATRFESRSFGQELTLCERYFEKTYPINTVPGTNVGPGTGEWTSVCINAADYYDFGKLRFVARKRISPTFTLYSTDGTINTARQQDTANIAIVVRFSSETGASLAPTGGTAGNYHRVHYTASAEF